MDYYASLFASNLNGGGGSGVTVEPLSVTENGTYQEEGKAYSPVNVNVEGWTTDEIASGAEPSGDVVVNTPKLKKYALAFCTNITSLVINSTQLNDNFIEGTSLSSVILPNLKNTLGNSFRSSLVPIIVLPAVTKIGVNGVNSTTHAQIVDVGSNCSMLDSFAFNGSTNINTLILRRTEGVVTMANVNSLASTKFKSGGAGGEIYIPKVLYDHLGDGTANDYQNATNWSTYDGYGTITWKAIEGSIYENAYADGTPIS